MKHSDTKLVDDHPWLFMLFGVTGAILLVAIDLATKDAHQSLIRESGGIEMATALLYGYAAVLWLWTRPGAEWKTSWQIPTVMVMMMGRELDLDKKITSVGLLKSDLYLTTQAPMMERLLGVIVVAFTVTMAVRLIRINGPTFIRGLRQPTLWAWATVGSIGFAVVSKSVDGLHRKLLPLGIDITHHTAVEAEFLEEFLELGIPLMFMVAILSSFIVRQIEVRSLQRSYQ